VAELLIAIEAEMRRFGLWSGRPPADAALRSELPFCCDSMGFDRWLQWVLVCRLWERLQTGQPLPGHSGITPMAELHFADSRVNALELIRLLRDLDRVLEGS